MKKMKLFVFLSLLFCGSAWAVPPCITNALLSVSTLYQAQLTITRYGTVITQTGSNQWAGTHLIYTDGPCNPTNHDGAPVLTVWTDGRQGTNIVVGSIVMQCSNGNSSTNALMVPAYVSGCFYWFNGDCSLVDGTCNVRVCSICDLPAYPNPQQ